MRKAPPKMFCRECGADMGRGWQSAPLCANCLQPGEKRCTCEFQNFDPECEIHEGRDPYDIPF